MTSIAVIAHAAKELGGGLPELRKTLATYGISDPLWQEVPKSKYVPDGVKELLDAGVDLLFVWGGDGTVQRAIDAIAGRPVTLPSCLRAPPTCWRPTWVSRRRSRRACGSVCTAPDEFSTWGR